jgi:hypothetical protein
LLACLFRFMLNSRLCRILLTVKYQINSHKFLYVLICFLTIDKYSLSRAFSTYTLRTV